MLQTVHLPTQVNILQTPTPNIKMRSNMARGICTHSKQGDLLAGFHLNNQLTQALTSRYRDSRLRVDFEHFVCCAARLTCIFRERPLLAGQGVGVCTRAGAACSPRPLTHRPLLPTPRWRRGGRLPDPQTGELA